MNSRELMKALHLIEEQRGIDREEIFIAIENSLISACKKNFGTSQNIKVDINRETGEVNVYAQKEVTEDVYDGFLEISLEEAREINPNYEYGDFVDIPITPRNFGRISAQAAKQVVVQKFREAEREKIYNEFILKENDVDTGIIRRIENNNIFVSLGKIDAVIPTKEQVPTEKYNVHDRLKVYIIEVKKMTKGTQITASRTHTGLVKRLFELEVPEIYEGVVEIKGIAREPGLRSKMAVYSRDENVEAIGACVGNNGSRVSVIVNELRGEKIDIINWDKDPKIFIAEALKPCQVLQIQLLEEKRIAKVVVPNEMLSLGIGKEGQNVRLAARLTGWKIDIKSKTMAEEIGFITEEDNLNNNSLDDMLKKVQDVSLFDEELNEEGVDINEYQREIENIDINNEDMNI